MEGLLRLQEKVKLKREGKWAPPDERPELEKMGKTAPNIGRLVDPARLTSKTTRDQVEAADNMGLGGRERDEPRSETPEEPSAEEPPVEELPA